MSVDKSNPPRQQPVAVANRSRHASHVSCVEWTEAAIGLYGPGIKLYAEPVAPVQPDVSGLVEALEYYAQGDHLALSDDSWDTCSGEPMNWLHDEAGTASVEDGSVAKAALAAWRAQQTMTQAAQDVLTARNRQIRKPRHARAYYVRAGALILAEIERLDRAALADALQGEGGAA